MNYIFIRNTLIIVIFLSFGLTQIATAKDHEEQTLSHPKLKSRSGYLVIALDIEVEQAKLKLKSKRQTRTLTLKPTEDNFIVVPITRGDYQVLEIQIPYFNLPYIVDLAADPRWKFNILSKHINYIGEIQIKKLRTRKSVSFEIHNNTAINQELFCQTYPDTCTIYPFRFAALYRDDFMTTLESINEHNL